MVIVNFLLLRKLVFLSPIAFFCGDGLRVHMWGQSNPDSIEQFIVESTQCILHPCRLTVSSTRTLLIPLHPIAVTIR